MDMDIAFALMGFAFVMSISPGPGNFLLLASGVNFGFRRSMPLILGISFGFLSMVFVVGLGVGEAIERTPYLGAVLKIACAAYVVWLAVKIARSRSLGSGADDSIERPISFIQAALFQLVNPKAWAVALILTVSYTDPANYLASLIAMIGLFALINIPAISVWAASGTALRQVLSQGARIAKFNLAMALLQVISIIPALIGT